MARVALYGTADAVHDMITAGAPLDGRDELPGVATPMRQMAGVTALERAAYRGDDDMLHVLLDAGVARNNSTLVNEAIAKAVGARHPKTEEILRNYLANRLALK